ncbi:MAG: hypothetical protein ACREJO_01260 [Phycisphaerales bacterium]
MEFVTHLWLPIVVCSVAVWIVSAIFWMALPHHKGDFKTLPDEQKLMDFMRAANIPPGVYGYPDFRNCKDPKSPDGKKQWNEGPMGLLNVWPKINMGRNMFLTFLVNLVVTILIAYLGHETIPMGAPFAKVMQVIGTAGVLAYAFAFLPNHIWFGANRSATWSSVFDGVVYGLVTGAIFGLMWPAK